MNTKNDKAGLGALLTPENSVLLLIDHQPFQFANLNSHEPTMIVNNVIGLAKRKYSAFPRSLPPSSRNEAAF